MALRSCIRAAIVGCCTLAAAGAALAQPANDLCVNATVITSLPYLSGDVNYGTATNDTGVNPSCDSTSNTDARQGVWWTFTPATTGTLQLAQIASPSQDTATSVWTGTCGALTQVACSDPESSTFSFTAGVQYFILISKWNTTNATAASNVVLFLGPIAAPADACTAPTPIAILPFATSMLVDTATNDTNVNPSCDSSLNTTGAKQGVWYSYTAGPAGAGLLLSEFGSQDIVLNAWSGASCTALTQVLCSDSEADISLSVPANTTYLLMVSKFNSTSYSTGNTIIFGVRAAAGACCSTSTGACTLTTSTCAAGTVATGGTTCAPDPCAGACCRADGTCTAGLVSACTNVGIYGGNGTSCPPGGPACPASVGRCCTGQTCTVTDSAGCTSIYTAGGTCTTNLCAVPCCDVLTGTCSLVAAGTACSGVQGAGGATCSSITCAAPANDLCANAQVIPGSGPFPLAIFGQNATATDTAVLSPTITPCGGSASSSSSRDVFYTFTPTQSRTYTFSLCNTYTGTLDTTMSIHTGCPAINANNLMCNDDGCVGSAGPSAIGGFAMTSGTTYIIRVARWSTGSGGKFQLDVTTEAFGACCDTSSVCLAKGISQCASPSTFIGDGTSCATSGICNGACCVPATGTCTMTSPASCTGTHGGIGSLCTPAFCPSTTCCNDSTGACTLTGTSPCPAGTTPNAAATCSPALCPISACCNDASGACTVTGSVACPSGTTAHAGVSCSPSPCPGQSCASPIPVAVGTVVPGDLASSVASSAISCSSGVKGLWYSFAAPTTASYSITSTRTSGTGNPSLGIFSACGTEVDCVNPCTGTVASSLQSMTAGQQIVFRLGGCGDTTLTWDLSISFAVVGACCDNTTGDCATSSSGAAGCSATSTYMGDNSVCSAVLCGQGACCNAVSGVCTLATTASCTGQFQSVGTSCSPNPCPQPPPPANDLCSAATDLNSIATFPGTAFHEVTSNHFATNDGPVPNAGACNYSGAQSEGLDNTIWYRYAPAASGTLHIRVAEIDDDFDMLCVFYSGPNCAALTEVPDPTCDGDGNILTPTETADYTRQLVAGTTYYLGIGDWGTSDGGGAVDVTLEFMPDAVPGVCCRGATCSTAYADAAACAAALDTTSTSILSKFVTGSAACNTPVTVPGTLGNVISPCCFANYNHNATLEVQDIFDFLNDWFAGKKGALVGGDGNTGSLAVQNIFDFLNAWFAGGCN